MKRKKHPEIVFQMGTKISKVSGYKIEKEHAERGNGSKHLCDCHIMF